MPEYENGIVRKPWGYEYLMYKSDKIGIWYLHITHGRQTSLHCHPGKKTGYILLSGEAEVSFLNNATRLSGLSKLMLREGLFHSTKAISSEGIHVIEVESPPDKTSLVRLDDAYGRKEQPYEGAEAVSPMTTNCITLLPPEDGSQAFYEIGGSTLIVERVDHVEVLRNRPGDEIILVLEGGLVSRNNEKIVSAGDVVSISTFNRLAETFQATTAVSIMTAKKCLSLNVRLAKEPSTC